LTRDFTRDFRTPRFPDIGNWESDFRTPRFPDIGSSTFGLIDTSLLINGGQTYSIGDCSLWLVFSADIDWSQIYATFSFNAFLFRPKIVPPFCHLVTKICQSLHSLSCPVSSEQTPARIATKIWPILRTHQNITSWLLLSLHNSFTPNLKHSSSTNPIMIHPFHRLLPTYLRLNSKHHRGHPFMTSTRRGGGGGQAQVDACGRGEGGPAPMWTSTQKIKIRVHWCHTVFFSCKEVGVVFTRISSLDRKKVDLAACWSVDQVALSLWLRHCSRASDSSFIAANHLTVVFLRLLYPSPLGLSTQYSKYTYTRIHQILRLPTLALNDTCLNSYSSPPSSLATRPGPLLDYRLDNPSDSTNKLSP